MARLIEFKNDRRLQGTAALRGEPSSRDFVAPERWSAPPAARFRNSAARAR